IYNQALNGSVMEEGMQGSALKKEEEDKSNEEEEIDHVPGVGKVVEQVQDTAAIKCVVEVPGLLQASSRPVTEDLQNKEVTFCPESATESIAALPKEANGVDKSEVGEPDKKASSSDLVEQEKKLKEAEDLKKAKTPKKIFVKPEKFFEEAQGSVAQKEEEEKSEEEDIVAVPMVEKILEESDASMLKRKLVLDTAEEPKKAKKPKKLLKKSKKTVEEAQCSDAIKEEHDKSKEEDEVAAVSMVQKVLENNQASVLKSTVAEESKKTKKIKKVLKKPKKKAEEPELLQASNRPVTGDSQDEDVTFCPESVTESIAALPEVANVVGQSEVSEPKNNASSSDLVEQEKKLEEEEESMKAITPKKILIKSKKIEEIMQDSDAKKEEHDKSKEEDEVVAVSMLEKVLDNSQASMLKSKISLDEVEESQKAIKKVLKKSKKKKDKEIQGTAAIKYDVEVPELLQASNRPVMEDSQDEEVTFCPESVTESIAALPKVANVVDQSEVGEPKKKASSSDLVEQEKKLEGEEELKKTKTPKKILINSKKNVEVVQDSAAKKEGEKKSKEEEYIVAVPIIEKILEDSQASMPKRKLVFDTVEEPKKAKRPKKLLKKSKKKVVEEQCGGAKKEEHDMSKEEDEVSVVEKVLENSEASVLKGKVSLDEVEESKKAKKIKKVLKKPKKNTEEMQGSAAIKYDVQVPELLQVSSRPVMEDSQNEEVTCCPESMTESLAALPKVANVVDLSEVGELKKKASSNDRVEQEKESEEQESKKPKTPKKILIKSKKNVEVVQGSDAKNEQEKKSKVEEDIVAFPIKRKLVLDTVDEPKKAKRPKKLLKKSKKNVVEEQCSGAKKEEHDMSKEEDEVAAVSVVEKVLENSEASVLKSKVSLDEMVESKKAKKIMKVLKMPKKKDKEMQGSAAIKYDVQVPELLQVSNRPVTEDSQNEEVAFCSESVTESIAALPEVANVVDQSEPKSKKNVEEVVQDSAAKKEEQDKSKEEDVVAAVSMVEKVLEYSQASVLKSKVSLDEVDESKKAKKIKKVLIKPKKKKAKEIQGTAAVKYNLEVPELLQESTSPVMEDSHNEEVTFSPESVTQSIAALPKVANVVDKSEVAEPKKKALLSDLFEQETKLEEESKEPKMPKKILIKSKENVEVVQGNAAKNEEGEKSKDEEDIVAVPIIEKSRASVRKRKLVLDTLEEPKIAKKPKKLLKKSKKKVEEEQCSAAKKEEPDMSKEEDEVAAVSKVEKVLENSQASMLKSKVSLDEVEGSKKVKYIKKALKRPKKKANEMQGSAAIKYDVEVPELLQASIIPVTEDSQNEEVTFCPERDTESSAALPKVAKVVNNSEVGGPKKKESSRDLVHQNEKLEQEEEELKKAKRPKKFLKKLKKKVELVQGCDAQKEEEDKPVVEEIVLKRKLVLDTGEGPMKAQRPKKVLQESKKKVEEVQGSAAK
ncbi:hypothetical protein MKX03_000650, partial [Papaver bracteatum]